MEDVFDVFDVCCDMFGVFKYFLLKSGTWIARLMLLDMLDVLYVMCLMCLMCLMCVSVCVCVCACVSLSD